MEHTVAVLFTGVRGETVWKIAEGVSPRLSGDKRRPNWDSFDPSWLLSEPRFGTYPEFPNSFSTTFMNKAKAVVSCIRARMPATNPPAPAGDEARRSTLGACWWDATRYLPRGWMRMNRRPSRYKRATTHYRKAFAPSIIWGHGESKGQARSKGQT
jgi:hypothetical protein